MSFQVGSVGGGARCSVWLGAAAGLTLFAAPVNAQSEFNARPTINVDGFGNVPTEGSSSAAYVANVVFAENGLASFEALKAQAVAARTFAYYQMDQKGFILNGTADQVYKRNGTTFPRAIHTAAANATEGEILWVRDNIGTPRDVLPAAFYVAGSIPNPNRPFDIDDPGIIVTPSDSDPTNTERFVTYTYENNLYGGTNQGTSLGFRGTPTNPNWPNRGAHSQNGADYLSDNSVNYLDILKYYYGADIQVRTVETAGTGVSLGTKILTDFDNYGSGRSSDGIIEGHDGVFNRDLDLATNASDNVAAALISRDTNNPFSGTHSQRLIVASNPESDEDWFVRHVAGARYAVEPDPFFGPTTSLEGEPIANLQFNATGSVGLYVRTTTPGVSVSLAIDDGGVGVTTSGFFGSTGPEGGDRGIAQELIPDGQWHRYEWFLEEAGFWEAWEEVGDGELTADRVSLDSIQFFGDADTTAFGDVYIDDVFWDPNALFVGIRGDYDGSGQVEQGDLNLVLNNWGSDEVPDTWRFGLPTGVVDQAELNAVLTNWGSSTAPSFSGFTVPEPTTAIAAFGLLGTALRRQKR
ncbi:MAG: SpoIID/LytB domain-containing protein [Planctomycetota bacterium]